MGAKNSKVKKGEKKGAAAGDESSDQVDKTATLPASFKKKVKTACGNMWVVIMICFSCPKKNLKFISIELALSPAPIEVNLSDMKRAALANSQKRQSPRSQLIPVVCPSEQL